MININNKKRNEKGKMLNEKNSQFSTNATTTTTTTVTIPLSSYQTATASFSLLLAFVNKEQKRQLQNI